MRFLFWILLFVAVHGFSSGAVFAQATGLGGGGEAVGRYLRDLIDPTCQWVRTDSPQAISVLETVHFRFARMVEQEVLKMSVCETEANLIRVQTNDQDSITAVPGPGAAQLAIRWDDPILGILVYVDMKLFRQLDSNSKDLLLVHEAMHGILSRSLPQRNNRVRSMVDTISRLAKSHPMTENEFAFQLKLNGFDPDPSLGAYRDQLNRFKIIPAGRVEKALLAESLLADPASRFLEDSEVAALQQSSSTWNRVAYLTCGSEGDIEQRVADCQAHKEGFATFQPDRSATAWELVSQTDQLTRIWRDQSSGLIWSAPISDRLNQSDSAWLCEGWRDNQTAFALGKIQANWRLPSEDEWLQAMFDGLLTVSPDLNRDHFWSSTQTRAESTGAWTQPETFFWALRDGVAVETSSTDHARPVCVSGLR